MSVSQQNIIAREHRVLISDPPSSAQACGLQCDMLLLGKLKLSHASLEHQHLRCPSLFPLHRGRTYCYGPRSVVRGAAQLLPQRLHHLLCAVCAALARTRGDALLILLHNLAANLVCCGLGGGARVLEPGSGAFLLLEALLQRLLLMPQLPTQIAVCAWASESMDMHAYVCENSYTHTHTHTHTHTYLNMYIRSTEVYPRSTAIYRHTYTHTHTHIHKGISVHAYAEVGLNVLTHTL